MKCLDPDTESAVRDFLARVPADIKVERAILYGCRARGEHRPDSDADVALILSDFAGDGTFMRLADLAYYSCLDSGIMVQPVPIAIDDWRNRESIPISTRFIWRSFAVRRARIGSRCGVNGPAAYKESRYQDRTRSECSRPNGYDPY